MIIEDKKYVMDALGTIGSEVIDYDSNKSVERVEMSGGNYLLKEDGDVVGLADTMYQVFFFFGLR